jgi:HEAT repeat protein
MMRAKLDYESGPPTSGPSPDSLAAAVLALLDVTDVGQRALAVEEAATAIDPSELVELLAVGDNSRLRNGAIEALSQGRDRAIPALLKALRDRDPEKVMFAAGVLGRSRARDVAPHLVALLVHEDINVAQTAIESLAQLRASSAVDALIGVLDGDPWLRFSAVRALGEIGEARAVMPLASTLPDDFLRLSAIEALGKIGTLEALRELVQVLRDAGDIELFTSCLCAVAKVIEQHPDEQVLASVEGWTGVATSATRAHELLERILLDDAALASADGVAVREAAIAVVRVLKIRDLYSAMMMAARDPRLESALHFAALAVGREIASAVEVSLRSPDPHVRFLAARCAGGVGVDNPDALVPLLQDAEAPVRRSALAALYRLRGERAAPALRDALADSDDGVVDMATSLLAKLDPERVTDVLLGGRAETSRVHTAMLRVMHDNPHPGQRVFIHGRLRDPIPEVRRWAVRALGQQTPFQLGDALRPLLSEPVLAVRREVVRVLARQHDSQTRRLLRDHIEADPETRIDAVRAFAERGDATIVPYLVELYDWGDRELRLAILEALTQLHDAGAEPLLARLLSDPDATTRRRATQLLGRFETDTARRHVLAATRDGDREVRLAATKLVVGLEGSARADALEKLCMDSDEVIATIAKHALEATAGEDERGTRRCQAPPSDLVNESHVERLRLAEGR